MINHFFTLLSVHVSSIIWGKTQRLNLGWISTVHRGPIVASIRYIWIASYAQKITPCVVEAVRECLQACKQTKLPVGPPTQFHSFQLEGKSLPAWIIFHSVSDDQSKSSTRHTLLQIILDEFPLTVAARDELYLACAATRFNNFFSRIRLVSLKQLQTRPAAQRTPMEIGRGLRLFPYLRETVTVVNNSTADFELRWFVPDMSQRLQSGLAVGIEFVAKGFEDFSRFIIFRSLNCTLPGHIWGLYIRADSEAGLMYGVGEWEAILCLLNPSRVSLKGTRVVMSLKVSRYERRSILHWGSTTTFRLQSYSIERRDLPVEGDMPKTEDSWVLSNYDVDSCRRCINNDGSCYLTISLVTG